ncbi:MAG TPA: hypothetical protein VGG68_12435 [Caulobacteraceae bacterium]
MSKGAQDPAKPDAKPENPKRWSAQAGRRGRPPLRLLGALRGVGTLIWEGGEGEVSYELDVFGAGDAYTANGALEGDVVAKLAPEAEEETAVLAARLRLPDDREIAVDILRLDPPLAEVEVGASDAAKLLPPR